MSRDGGEKKRKDKIGNRIAVATISFVALILAVTMTVRSNNLKKRDAQLHQQVLENEQLIENEEARTEQLEQHKKEVNTLQYIEQIAREKLGLVSPDEIIIVPEE